MQFDNLPFARNGLGNCRIPQRCEMLVKEPAMIFIPDLVSYFDSMVHELLKNGKEAAWTLQNEIIFTYIKWKYKLTHCANTPK